MLCIFYRFTLRQSNDWKVLSRGLKPSSALANLPKYDTTKNSYRSPNSQVTMFFYITPHAFSLTLP